MSFLTSLSNLRVALVASLLVAAVGGADAGMMSRRMLERVGQRTPQPVLVREGDEMQLAEQAAAKVGGLAFWGVGESMQPLYAPNTAIVITPVEYDAIRKGMTVVYRKPNGRCVAHAVIGEDANGYIVQGMNNDEPDAVSVNEKNLIGVITAAFSANDSQFRLALAHHAADSSKAVASRRSPGRANF